MAALFLLALTTTILTLLPALPAAAHATLEESSPQDSSLLPRSPAQVSLRYDQPVSTALGAVRVLAPDGTRVDDGAVATRDDGRVVVAGLRSGLPAGTYTILWRVLSADAHTIFGASTFSVGRPSVTSASVQEAGRDTGGRSAEFGLQVARATLYTGIVLLLGFLGFIRILWPAGWFVRTVRRSVWAGLLFSAGGSVVGLLAQGPYAAGRPLAAALDPSLLAEVLTTRFGQAAAVRLVVLAGLALLIRRAGPRRPPPAPAVFVLGGIALLSISVVGHAGSADLAVVALPLDMLHLASAAAWLGGLVLVAGVLLRRHRPVGSDELAVLLPRWSRYAAISVVLLVVSGTFAGWRQIRESDAITATTYGRLLLVKVALVAGMVALGALGRRRIARRIAVASSTSPPQAEPAVGARQLPAGADLLPARAVRPETERHAGPGLAAGSHAVALEEPRAPAVSPVAPGALLALRRGVLLETVLATVVLAVTAVLVGTVPARDAYFPVFTATGSAATGLTVQVVVAPARAGLNRMDLTFSGIGGRPTDVLQSTARWTQQGGGTVVPVQLTRAGPGHYAVDRVVLPAAGWWQLALTTQTSEIDSTTTLFTVRVR